MTATTPQFLVIQLKTGGFCWFFFFFLSLPENSFFATLDLQQLFDFLPCSPQLLHTLLILLLPAARICSSDWWETSKTLSFPPSLPKDFNNLLSFLFFFLFFSPLYFFSFPYIILVAPILSLLIHYVTMNLSSNTSGDGGRRGNGSNIWQDYFGIIIAASFSFSCFPFGTGADREMFPSSSLQRIKMRIFGQNGEATTEGVWNTQNIKWCCNFWCWYPGIPCPVLPRKEKRCPRAISAAWSQIHQDQVQGNII